MSKILVIFKEFLYDRIQNKLNIIYLFFLIIFNNKANGLSFYLRLSNNGWNFSKRNLVKTFINL